MDNFKNNDTTKKILSKKQKTAFSIFFITSLIISFCASYFITDYITNPNKKITKEEENQNVYANNNYLSEDLFITLKTNDTTDYLDKLNNLIKKFNLKENITEEELSNELSKEGYLLSEKSEKKLTFTRSKEVTNSKFEANKYYLGEENGYISIFKTDANGEIIESEKKVYSNSKPISNLPETDQNYIKENKFSFSSKEEALQKLSEMIS